MKSVLLGLLILNASLTAKAGTCEEVFSQNVSSARTYCASLSSPDCSFSNRESIITNYNEKALEILCWRTCPQEPAASGTIATSYAYLCKGDSGSVPRMPLFTEQPTICPGSIVQVENQVLGESIPVTGTGFSLNYFSNWTEGRVGDYKIRIPLIGSVPRDNITSYDVSVIKNGLLVDSAHYDNTGSNINFTYEWDGTDHFNEPTLASFRFQAIVVENRPGITIPIVSNLALGNFKARLIGLGGWVPSNYVVYDSLANKLIKADGSVRTVEAKYLAANQWRVAEQDGSLVYIFQNDRLLFVKSGFLGTTLSTFNYDSEGRLTLIVEPFSRTTTFNRNSNGELTSIISPRGDTTTVTFDSSGYLGSVVNPNSESYVMTYYGTKGLLNSFQKPGLQVSTFDYDSDGNLIKDSHSGGYFFELVKAINPNYSFDVSLTSRMGRGTRVLGNGNAASLNRTVTKPSSVQETSSYSISTNSKSESWSKDGEYGALNYGADPRFPGQSFYLQSSYRQDGAGSKIVSSTPSVTLSATDDPFSISAWSNVTRFNYSNNAITTTYSPISKTFNSSSYLGKTSQYSIDNYERVIAQKTGNLYSVELTYTDENLTKIKQSSREASLAYYAISGLLQSVTNSLNQTTGFTYDSVGRLSAKTLPDSRVIGYSYDANGNVASIAPPGRPAHYFNLNSQELASLYAPPALSGLSVVSTTYLYNLDKQLTQVTRPDGSAINFTYNSTTGVLSSMSVPSGTYSYNMSSQNGLPSTIYFPGGASTQIGYAGKKMVNSANYSSSYQNIGTYTPTFTSYSLLGSDNVSSYGGSGTSVSYSYNDDEDLISAGSESLAYNTPNGQLVGTSIGAIGADVTDSYIYNNFGEVTGYQAKYAGSVIYDLSLARDGMGRISGKSQSMNSVTDAFAYTFDVTGRLTQTDKNSATVATYVYDDNSNRTGGVIGAQTTVATYDNQDRLDTYNTLSFTYNANGDLTSKTNSTLSQTTNYVYDVFGNLTQVTLPSADVITYEIDGLNRRIGKKLNGTLQKRWVYMDQYRIAAEIDASGAITKRFVYGSKGNIPDYMIYGGENYRIISDHLGSPRLVVKVSDGSVVERMNHDVYGRVTEDTNPGVLPFGFAGGLYEGQTSLVRFGARDYDPEVGRWTSKDPILFNGGDTNLFGYVQNDPVNFIDPDGKFPLPLILGALAGIFYATDTDISGAAQDEMIGVPMAAAGGWMAGGGICKATDTSIQYRNYPNSGGGGVGIYRNNPLSGQSKNIIRADVHPIKSGGRSVPHIDIPGVVKHWPWGK